MSDKDLRAKVVREIKSGSGWHKPTGDFPKLLAEIELIHKTLTLSLEKLKKGELRSAESYKITAEMLSRKLSSSKQWNNIGLDFMAAISRDEGGLR